MPTLGLGEATESEKEHGHEPDAHDEAVVPPGQPGQETMV